MSVEKTIMMDAWIRGVVEAIHSAPNQTVLYLAGGASQALGWLMSVPGASNTVLEAVVPYSRMSFIQLLGKIPSQHCSRQTAEEMALLAYNRGLKLSRPGDPVVGVGFTGSLASSRPKFRGSQVLLVNKNIRSTFGIYCHIVQGPENSGARRYSFKSAPTQGYCKCMQSPGSIYGKICFKVYPFSSETYTSTAERKIILSGSFDPLHEGHIKLLEVATSICGNGYPCFEISSVNADKPPLSVSQIKDRIKQFEKAGKRVIISNQPFFYKKAELFPGSAFVIGADTVARLINPKYYGGDYGKMLEVLDGCKRIGCTFLVGGRNVDGVFKVLEDFDIPDTLKDMFVSIPADRFPHGCFLHRNKKEYWIVISGAATSTDDILLCC
ncbi:NICOTINAMIDE MONONUCLEOTIDE ADENYLYLTRANSFERASE [Salix viminalis]|uniref:NICOTINAMIDE MONONUCLEOTIDE ADENYLYLTRANSFERASE n=1 Tax=Salix viminalis TaxID=40686 RepID=A0A9Q0U0H2_SALVM|nr:NICOTINAMIDE MONONUCLEOTIDE ADENYLYLTRANSFERASE [Salix viminalis]